MDMTPNPFELGKLEIEVTGYEEPHIVEICIFERYPDGLLPSGVAFLFDLSNGNDGPKLVDVVWSDGRSPSASVSICHPAYIAIACRVDDLAEAEFEKHWDAIEEAWADDVWPD